MSSPKARHSIVSADFFVLRTPLLPFSVLTDWSAGLRAPSAQTPEQLDAALAEDTRVLRERLACIVSRPEVREALFLASPSLEERLAEWLAHPMTSEGRNVERALVRYVSRMAGRPTPFGLFAGWSVGALGRETRLFVPDRRMAARHTRLDGDYLCDLAEALAADPAIRSTLVYRPNDTLYRVGDRLRYVETCLTGRIRTYHLVTVEASELIDATLSRAARGERLGHLSEALVCEDVTRPEADEFVGQLVQHQLLVPELTPSVTGAEPIHDLVDQLGRHPETSRIADSLRATRDEMAKLDRLPLGSGLGSYETAKGHLVSLPGNAPHTKLFQVDLVKRTEAGSLLLGPEPIAEIIEAYALLHRLSRNPAEPASLERFRRAFVRRYGQREVPLALALDEESGIGFGHLRSSAVVAEDAAAPEDGDFDPQSKWAVSKIVFAKLEAALRGGVREVVLEKEEFDRCPPHKLALPNSMAVLARLSVTSRNGLSTGDFLVWNLGYAGPSAATVLGRFCHADEQVAERTHGLVQEEQERHGADAAFAEIAHWPQGRAGNVLVRPVLRTYEIPFVGRSGAPLDRQIAVDDLMVSLRDNRIVLRSRRLDLEVIPRLSTTHNFSYRNNIGVYRFLGALQWQGLARLELDLTPATMSSFVPRIRFGRVVLSPALWRLDERELRQLRAPSDSACFAAMQRIRRERDLPRWVCWNDGDQALPVDLDNVLCVKSLMHALQKTAIAELMEMPPPDGLCANGPEGSFVHEVVVPLWCNVPHDADDATRAPISVRVQRRDDVAPRAEIPVRRTFTPGSEWLYAKLYCGPGTADTVLREAIAPLIERSMRAGSADAWFFVRYADPDVHLRLRLQGLPRRLMRDVLPSLGQAMATWMTSGALWKLQVDTYEREIERYGGGEGMLLAEDLFFFDSEAVLTLLRASEDLPSADMRWRLALLGMDQLLSDLGFDVSTKLAVVRSCKRGFGSASGSNAPIREWADLFRKERRALEALLAGDVADIGLPWQRAARAILDERSARVRPTIDMLHRAARRGRLTQSLPELAPSFLHMHANRMLRFPAGAQELRIYDVLDRLYDGQLARTRSAPVGPLRSSSSLAAPGLAP
jgi:thiopeptide-type bacteriocin biosynthesis protein